MAAATSEAREVRAGRPGRRGGCRPADGSTAPVAPDLAMAATVPTDPGGPMKRTVAPAR
jgi:hypothetical protein